ncbi:MAG: hypothetical protein K8S55_09100 [Phycisphaerae bacterium]|nr:hypothetical protein [Phycisphaerae bacterium]
MNNTRRGLTAFVLVIAGLAGSVIGQDVRIDRRYAPGQRAQGRLLDASLEYGSGGINSAVPTNYVNTHISSLTESRGLSGFSGRAPNLSRSLRVRDISGGISTFRQQSLGGAYSSRSGNLYRPQEMKYDNPLTRTLHTRDIVRAESIGRLPLPKNVTRNNKIANKLFVDATVDYKSFMPVNARVTGRELGLGRDDPRHAIQNQLIHKFESHDIAQRGGDELFGVLRQEDRAKLARELSEFRDEDKADKVEADQQAVDAQVDARIGEPLEAETGKELVERLRKPGEPRETEDARDSRDKRKLRPDRMSTSTPDIPGENQDVFFDLLLKLQEQKRQDREAEAKAKEAAKAEAQDAIRELPDEEPSPAETALPYRIRQESRLEPSERFVEVDAKKHLIIHNLAGTSKDLFNRYMNRAKKDLLAGRSYQASRWYELATMVRPKNPLAYLGGCLSTFAAGEWFTASRRLQAAVELFPPLMETKLNIPKLMPAKTFRTKLAALENWIATINEKDVQLLFMAAFLQHNDGNDNGARRHAKTILEVEKSDRQLIKGLKKKTNYKILLQRHEERYRIPKAYAEYLLSGKVPSKQSAKPKGFLKDTKAPKAK